MLLGDYTAQEIETAVATVVTQCRSNAVHDGIVVNVAELIEVAQCLGEVFFIRKVERHDIIFDSGLVFPHHGTHPGAVIIGVGSLRSKLDSLIDEARCSSLVTLLDGATGYTEESFLRARVETLEASDSFRVLSCNYLAHTRYWQADS